MMVLKGEELKGLLSDGGAVRIILNCKSRKATVAQSSKKNRELKMNIIVTVKIKQYYINEFSFE